MLKMDCPDCHDGLSLPFDFKLTFQNETILIKSNLINKKANPPGQ